jgi:hypothetical protein
VDWIDCAMQIAIVVAAIGPVHYQFAICGRVLFKLTSRSTRVIGLGVNRI